MALTKLTPGGVPEQLILPGNIVARVIFITCCRICTNASSKTSSSIALQFHMVQRAISRSVRIFISGITCILTVEELSLQL